MSQAPKKSIPANGADPLTAAEIKQRMLSLNDLRVEPVDTPEWAEEGLARVWVRNLTVVEAARLRETETEAEGQLLAISLGACDATGESLDFTEAELTLLANRSVGPMRRLHDKIYDLSYLTVEAVDEAAKNSPETGGDASGSN